MMDAIDDQQSVEQVPDVTVVSQGAQTILRQDQQDQTLTQTEFGDSISTPMQHTKSRLKTTDAVRSRQMGSLLQSENQGVQTSPERNITLQQFLSKLSIPYMSLHRQGSPMPDIEGWDKCPENVFESLRQTHLVGIERDVMLGCLDIIQKSINEKKVEFHDKQTQLTFNNPADFQKVSRFDREQISELSQQIMNYREQLRLSGEVSWLKWLGETQEHLHSRYQQAYQDLRQKLQQDQLQVEEISIVDSNVDDYRKRVDDRRTEYLRRMKVKKLIEDRNRVLAKRDSLQSSLSDMKKKQKTQVQLEQQIQQKNRLEQQCQQLQHEVDVKSGKVNNPDYYIQQLQEANLVLKILEQMGIECKGVLRNNNGRPQIGVQLAGCFMLQLEFLKQKRVNCWLRLCSWEQVSWKIKLEHYELLNFLFGTQEEHQRLDLQDKRLQQQFREWLCKAQRAKELITHLKLVRLCQIRMFD